MLKGREEKRNNIESENQADDVLTLMEQEVQNPVNRRRLS
jgi:hypothetical protein